jgi:hypothetical protein
MNLGANVLDVLGCRWMELVRRREGMELIDAVGECDCCRPWLDVPVGVGVGEAKRSDLLKFEGDMGDCIDMSE